MQHRDLRVPAQLLQPLNVLLSRGAGSTQLRVLELVRAHQARDVVLQRLVALDADRLLPRQHPLQCGARSQRQRTATAAAGLPGQHRAHRRRGDHERPAQIGLQGDVAAPLRPADPPGVQLDTLQIPVASADLDQITVRAG
ncbi:hypothetical protein [Amycolatopsis pithecellobii]|uniref:Uncharacterized protein n=1 Tax=Amycolatopsis pithecellobii TaxID=664692 RepID=A0A6N7ZCN4_9PSEU|nr:hypothetical protein [Amycolatopsis pithecellobii]MTD59377.1 hypothetical protein [Amycolatopsis pithecellobii]